MKPNMGTLLGVHEITKKFGAVNALRGVTIEFAKGEIPPAVTLYFPDGKNNVL
jgi:ABC-type branched-subunit amino acid transport system ATPase component